VSPIPLKVWWDEVTHTSIELMPDPDLLANIGHRIAWAGERPNLRGLFLTTRRARLAKHHDND
ncbi:MAG TPA: hypothetical protein VKQ30_24755, partial [Ktedonobacterales bacterium]|nr:hypothetical protein [Ktedonobacterales bacterium]